MPQSNEQGGMDGGAGFFQIGSGLILNEPGPPQSKEDEVSQGNNMHPHQMARNSARYYFYIEQPAQEVKVVKLRGSPTSILPACRKVKLLESQE